MHFIQVDKTNCSAAQYNEGKVQEISLICEPLKRFNIINFSYFKIYPSGEYFFISNNTQYHKFHLFNIREEAMVCEGVKQLRQQSDPNGIISVLWPELPTSKITQAMYDHGFWHGMGIRKFSADGVEGASFMTSIDNSNIRELYIRNCDMLVEFFHYFKKKACSIIKLEKEDAYKIAFLKNGITLPVARPALPEDAMVNSFWDELCCAKRDFIYSNNVPLSPREIECMSGIAAGKTAKEIARDFKISSRTVEVHICNIKHKTGCYLRSDFVKFYQDNFR